VHLARFSVEAEVVLPPVAAWVEQQHVQSSNLVPTCGGVGFVQVAGFAGEGEIIQQVIAARGTGQDVLDVESEIEDLFRGVTVLAAVPRSFSDRWIARIHDLTSGSA
jgi:hypothetical protein